MRVNESLILGWNIPAKHFSPGSAGKTIKTIYKMKKKVEKWENVY
jgi:hypothetical protein